MARRTSSPKPKNVFLPAPAVAEMAREVVKDAHGRLSNAKIAYYFQSQASKKAGKIVLASTKLVSNLNAFLAGQSADEEKGVEPMFVITVSKIAWEKLSDEQCRALLDHQLSYCGVTDKGKLQMLVPDLIEFHGVVARHGTYRKDIEDFVKLAMRKSAPSLPMEDMPVGSPDPTPIPPTVKRSVGRPRKDASEGYPAPMGQA